MNVKKKCCRRKSHLDCCCELFVEESKCWLNFSRFLPAIFRYNGVRFSISRILDIGEIAILLPDPLRARFSGLLRMSRIKKEMWIRHGKFQKTHFHRIDVDVCWGTAAVGCRSLIKNEFPFSNIIKPFFTLPISTDSSGKVKIKISSLSPLESWLSCSVKKMKKM